ncbi:MAG: hypothetical protein M9894_38735 [Planctomycetes bacterium]|nr:hypothetical protein [Planctomycetota bacterium]
MRIQPRLTDDRAPVCPLCRAALVDEVLPSQGCEGCGVRYHDDCARELGGCATPGCARQGAPPGADEAAERERRRAALCATHEERLRRFRAARDDDRRRRRLTDAGLLFQLAALAGAGWALWQLLLVAKGQPEHAFAALGGLLLAGVLLVAGRALDRG